jgi:TP901 family phage tail tape measure protein
MFEQRANEIESILRKLLDLAHQVDSKLSNLGKDGLKSELVIKDFVSEVQSAINSIDFSSFGSGASKSIRKEVTAIKKALNSLDSIRVNIDANSIADVRSEFNKLISSIDNTIVYIRVGVRTAQSIEKLRQEIVDSDAINNAIRDVNRLSDVIRSVPAVRLPIDGIQTFRASIREAVSDVRLLIDEIERLNSTRARARTTRRQPRLDDTGGALASPAISDNDPGGGLSDFGDSFKKGINEVDSLMSWFWKKYSKFNYAVSQLAGMFNGLRSMVLGIKSGLHTPEGALDIAGGFIRFSHSLRNLDTYFGLNMLPKKYSQVFNQRRSETLADTLEALIFTFLGRPEELNRRKLAQSLYGVSARDIAISLSKRQREGLLSELEYVIKTGEEPKVRSVKTEEEEEPHRKPIGKEYRQGKGKVGASTGQRLQSIHERFGDVGTLNLPYRLSEIIEKWLRKLSYGEGPTKRTDTSQDETPPDTGPRASMEASSADDEKDYIRRMQAIRNVARRVVFGGATEDIIFEFGVPRNIADVIGSNQLEDIVLSSVEDIIGKGKISTAEKMGIFGKLLIGGQKELDYLAEQAGLKARPDADSAFGYFLHGRFAETEQGFVRQKSNVWLSADKQTAKLLNTAVHEFAHLFTLSHYNKFLDYDSGGYKFKIEDLQNKVNDRLSQMVENEKNLFTDFAKRWRKVFVKELARTGKATDAEISENLSLNKAIRLLSDPKGTADKPLPSKKFLEYIFKPEEIVANVASSVVVGGNLKNFFQELYGKEAFDTAFGILKQSGFFDESVSESELQSRYKKVFERFVNQLVDRVASSNEFIDRYQSDINSELESLLGQTTTEDNKREKLKDIVQQSAEIAEDKVDNISDVWKDLISNSSTLFGKIRTTLLGGIEGWVKGIRNIGKWIREKYSSILNSIVGGLFNLPDTQTLSASFDETSSPKFGFADILGLEGKNYTFLGLFEKIRDKVKSLLKSLTERLKGVTDWLFKPENLFVSGIYGVEIGQPFASFSSDDSIKTLINKVTDNLKSMFKLLFDGVKSAVFDIPGVLLQYVEGLKTKVPAFHNKILNNIVTMIPKPIIDIKNALEAGWSSVFNSMTSYLGNFSFVFGRVADIAGLFIKELSKPKEMIDKLSNYLSAFDNYIFGNRSKAVVFRPAFDQLLSFGEGNLFTYILGEIERQIEGKKFSFAKRNISFGDFIYNTLIGRINETGQREVFGSIDIGPALFKGITKFAMRNMPNKTIANKIVDRMFGGIVRSVEEKANQITKQIKSETKGTTGVEAVKRLVNTDFFRGAASLVVRSFAPDEEKETTESKVRSEILRSTGQSIEELNVETLFNVAEGIKEISASAKLADGSLAEFRGTIDEFGRFSVVRENQMNVFQRYGQEMIRELFRESAESLVFGLMNSVQSIFQTIFEAQADLKELAYLVGAQTEQDITKAQMTFVEGAVRSAVATGQKYEDAIAVQLKNVKLLSYEQDIGKRMYIAEKLSKVQLGAQTVFGLDKDIALREVPSILTDIANSLGDIPDRSQRTEKAALVLETLFDKLVVLQKATSAEGENMIKIISELGVASRKFGLSYEELAVISALSDVTISEAPQETSNIIKMLFERLTSGKEKLAAMGITGETPIELLKSIYALSQDKSKKSVYEQAIALIGEKRLGPQTEKIIQAIGVDFDRLMELSRSTKGTEFERMLQVRLEGFTNTMNQFQSSIARFFYVFVEGTGLLNAFNKAISAIAKNVDKFSDFVEQNIGLFSGILTGPFSLTDFLRMKYIDTLALPSQGRPSVFNPFTPIARFVQGAKRVGGGFIAEIKDSISPRNLIPSQQTVKRSLINAVADAIAPRSNYNARNLLFDFLSFGKTSVKAGGSSSVPKDISSALPSLSDAIDDLRHNVNNLSKEAKEQSQIRSRTPSFADQLAGDLIGDRLNAQALYITASNVVLNEKGGMVSPSKAGWGITPVEKRGYSPLVAERDVFTGNRGLFVNTLPQGTVGSPGKTKLVYSSNRFADQTRPGFMQRLGNAGDVIGSLALPVGLDLLLGGPDAENLTNIGVGVAGAFAGAIVGGPYGAVIGYTLASSFSEAIDLYGVFGTSKKEISGLEQFYIREFVSKTDEQRKLAEQIRPEVESELVKKVITDLGVDKFTNLVNQIGRDKLAFSGFFSTKDYIAIREQIQQGKRAVDALPPLSFVYQRARYNQYQLYEPLVQAMMTSPSFKHLDQLLSSGQLNLSDIIADLPQAALEIAKNPLIVDSEMQKRVENILQNRGFESDPSRASVELLKQIVERNEASQDLLRESIGANYENLPYKVLQYGPYGTETYRTRLEYETALESAKTDEEREAIKSEYDRRLESMMSLPNLYSQIMAFEKGFYGGQEKMLYTPIDPEWLEKTLLMLDKSQQDFLSGRLKQFEDADRFVREYEEKQRQLFELQQVDMSAIAEDEAVVYKKRIEALQTELSLYREKYNLSAAIVEQAKSEGNVVQSTLNMIAKDVQNKQRRMISPAVPARFVSPSIFDVSDIAASDLISAIQYAREKQKTLTAMNPEYAKMFAAEQFLLQSGGTFKKVAGIDQSFVQEYLRNIEGQRKLPDVVDLRKMSVEQINKVVERAKNLQTQALQFAPDMAGKLEKERLVLLAKNNQLLFEVGVGQEFLRAALEDNAEATEGLRGHYNLPAGYRMPTIWDYYDSGGTSTGEVNFPTGADKNLAPLDLVQKLAQTALEGGVTTPTDLNAIGDIIEPGSRPFFYPEPGKPAVFEGPINTIEGNVKEGLFVIQNSKGLPEAPEAKGYKGSKNAIYERYKELMQSGDEQAARTYLRNLMLMEKEPSVLPDPNTLLWSHGSEKIDTSNLQQQLNILAMGFQTATTQVVNANNPMAQTMLNAQASVNKFIEALKRIDASKINLNLVVNIDGKRANVSIAPSQPVTTNNGGSLYGTLGSRRPE